MAIIAVAGPKGGGGKSVSLQRHVKSFVGDYHESRTHLSLAKDAAEPHHAQTPQLGRIVIIPQVSGLHHRYERRPA